MHSDEHLQPPTAGELKTSVALMVVANLFAVIFGGYIPLSVCVHLCSEISSGLPAAEITKHVVGAAGCLLFGIILPLSFGWISIQGTWKAYQRYRSNIQSKAPIVSITTEGSPAGATLSHSIYSNKRILECMYFLCLIFGLYLMNVSIAANSRMAIYMQAGH